MPQKFTLAPARGSSVPCAPFSGVLVLELYHITLVLFHDTENKRDGHEMKIHKHLFTGYEKDAHPTKTNNSDKVVRVTFDVQLIRILEIVSKSLLILAIYVAGNIAYKKYP